MTKLNPASKVSSEKSASVSELLQTHLKEREQTRSAEQQQTQLIRNAVAGLRHTGLTTGEIARVLDLPIERIEAVTSNNEFVDRLLQIQLDLGACDFGSKAQVYAQEALDKLYRLLLTEKDPRTVSKIAMDLIDRGEGKAVQRTEIKSASIVDVTTRTESIDRAIEQTLERIKLLEGSK